MSIERRGNQIYYRFSFRGAQIRRATGLVVESSSPKDHIPAEIKRQARAMEARARALLLTDDRKPRKHKKFLEGAAEFLRWCETTEYRAKNNTFLRIRTSFASLVEFFGEMRISDIDSGGIEQFKTWRITEHGVRDITLRHDLYNLSVFFKKYALKMHWADVNPVEKVTMPSDKEAFREHVLTEEEERAYFLVASANNRNLYDTARLILLQGCRPEEVFSLDREDVNVAARQMRIRGGKTRSARRVLDLADESLEILSRRALAAIDSRWLFPSPTRKGRHIVKLNNAHDQACIDAGVSFTMYDLRHTFATRMLATGVDVATVAALLGHGSLRTVYRYLHPQAGVKKDAMRKYQDTLTPLLKVV